MLTPYQFASNSPIANIDLDGLEQYEVVHYLNNQGGLAGLKVVLKNRDAAYEIIRASSTKPMAPPGVVDIDTNGGYIPPRLDQSRELAAMNGIRSSILKWLNGSKANGSVIEIFGPIRVSKTPKPIPPINVGEIALLRQEILIPERAILRPSTSPRLIDDINLGVEFGKDSDMPLNASRALSNVRSVVSRLAEDESLSVKLQVSLGSGVIPTQDEAKQELQRLRRGQSYHDLVKKRGRRLYNAFIKEAKRQGVDPSRIGEPTIEKTKGRTGNAEIYKQE